MTKPLTVRALPADIDLVGDFAPLLASFLRHLRAERKSPLTLKSYDHSVRTLAAFLDERGMPSSVADVTREHIEECLVWLHATYSPNSVYTYFAGIRAFFSWLLDEGEITRSPMDRLKRPTPTQETPAVLTPDELDRLFKACAGPEFDDRRDEALVRLMAETGMRRAEAAGLMVADVDLDTAIAKVLGKGRTPRLAPFGPTTARAIDRYLRLRRKHPRAALPHLWLGKHGGISVSGLAYIVGERAKAAGIDGFHLHRLRHNFADRFLSAGGQESDLMVLAGWKSREMMSRYGRSRAEQRAIEAARRLALGEEM